MALQIGFLALDLFVLTGTALFLHAQSQRYGLAPLLVYLTGLVAVLNAVSPMRAQVVFGPTYVDLFSVTFVPVILMTVLVLYQAEGTAATRLSIYGIIGVSVLVLLVQLALTIHLSLPGGRSDNGFPLNISLFSRSGILTLASILAFSGSLFGVAVVHQAVSNSARWIPGWTTPGVALFSALLLDETIFRTSTLTWRNLFAGIPGGLTAKLIGGTLICWPMVAVYLHRVAPHLKGYRGMEDRRPLEVVFGTYRTQESALRTTRLERRRAERALQESEIRFRTTFEQARIGLVHTGLSGRILKTNRFLCDLLGYTAEEMRALTWKDITHPENQAQCQEAMEGLVEGRLDGYEVDKRYLRKNGEEVWAHLAVSLVRDARGNPDYLVGAVEDLTERRATEESLRQAQKMEAVGQLTGGIAHDFNNLLTVIMGGLELALHPRAGQAEARRVMEEAFTAAKKGGALTQRLLAFSRKQALRPIPVEPASLLKDIREILARTLGETIRVEVAVEEGTGRCLVDQTQMQNAVLNLAINARDAMPGGGRILIGCAPHQVGEGGEVPQGAMPGRFVRVSVSDEGVGIPPENLKRVFEPFFTTKEAGKGSGLGLSMVYGFARQSGGFVAVESEVGKGTTVSLHLPRAGD